MLIFTKMARAIRVVADAAMESFKLQALTDAYVFWPSAEFQDVIAEAALKRHAKEYPVKKVIQQLERGEESSETSAMVSPNIPDLKNPNLQGEHLIYETPLMSIWF